MKIIVTGALGNIGKPLTKKLVQSGHEVTVISSNLERKNDIEALGAKAAIGTVMDIDFLVSTFKEADAVYLMGIWEAIGSRFDATVNFEEGFIEMANNYKRAIEETKIKKVIYLSTIGAHTDQGIGVLKYHYNVEQVLNKLNDVSVKFMRPVGFFTNLLRSIPSVKASRKIVQNFGSDKKEPWVSPIDIAQAIAEEMEKPFGKMEVRYIASEEISATEIIEKLRVATESPDLKWVTISDEEMLNNMLSQGMNEKLAKGFIEMQASQRTGYLYEDYYRNKPVLGNVKFSDFAKDFAFLYNQNS